MVDIKIVEPTELNLYRLEKLRLESFNVKGMKPEESYYFKTLDSKYVILGAYIEDRLVGAAYIRNQLGGIIVDQIFVEKNHRKEHIGSSLMDGIKLYKEYIEEILKPEFQVIKLESVKEAEGFYERLGFRKSKSSIYYKAI